MFGKVRKIKLPYKTFSYTCTNVMFVILLRVNLVGMNDICYICTNVAYVMIQERPEKENRTHDR